MNFRWACFGSGLSAMFAALASKLVAGKSERYH
jgi:hypothetical protein